MPVKAKVDPLPDMIAPQIMAGFRHRQYEAMEKKRAGLFHVSDYVNICARNAFYSHLKDNKQRMGLEAMSVLWAGEAIHTFLDRGAETKMAWNIVDDKTPEAGVEANKVVWGELDALYSTVIDGELRKIIVDYKTWLSKGFPLKAMKPEHLKQLEYYRFLYQRTHNEDIEYGGIIYLDFGERFKSPKIFVKKLRSLDEIHGELLERQREFAAAMSTGKPPERHVDWLCNYCPHAARCFSNETKVDSEMVINAG